MPVGEFVAFGCPVAFCGYCLGPARGVVDWGVAVGAGVVVCVGFRDCDGCGRLGFGIRT